MGTVKRALVEMPPRHGKSELVSRWFVVWFLGTFPKAQIILVSATDDLAQAFSRSARDTFAEIGPKVFGFGLSNGQQATHHWETAAGGGCKAAGIGGDIIGRGADLLIVDDYCRNVEAALSENQREKALQWFLSTAKTRLTPDGAIVIVATRWHPKDLIGGVLAEAEITGEKWDRVKLPALAEEGDSLGRQPGEALWPDGPPGHAQTFDVVWMEAKRRSFQASGYEWMWEALYQQNPPDVLNSKWPAEYFHEGIWFDTWDQAPQLHYKVTALDPSVGKTDKACYSAFVWLGVDDSGRLWVDADLRRRDIHQIIQFAMDHAREWSPHQFGVETVQFQAVLQDLFWKEARRRRISINAVGIPSRGISKTQRIEAGLTELLARDRLRFRRSPGTSLLVEQMKGFPAVKYDDGPDALAMAAEMVALLVNHGMPGDEPEVERVVA